MPKVCALLALLCAGCGSSAVGTATGDAGIEANAAPRSKGGIGLDSRFVTRVVSFQPGPCAGFGAEQMPDVVYGPPEGGGDTQGSLDVVSLGRGGSIVLSFEPNAIVDGDGADFVVFENPFFVAGDPHAPKAELGEVSVSEDGVAWKTFPCTDRKYPYGSCAGWHPVYSSAEKGISPFDPERAGGDAFDLRDVGLTRARYVRIVDMGLEECTAGSKAASRSNGFDLDAVSVAHGELK